MGPTLAAPMSPLPHLIAVIDDEEPVRKALGRLLVSAGLAVELFGGGADFLASLVSRRPDCAVLDLHMPDVSGFDVLAQLTTLRTGVPVIVITGNESPETAQCTLESGASAFLHKPINDRVLLDAIAAAIAGARQKKESSPQTPPSPQPELR